MMEYDIHTLLDSATLVFTLWVIYMIRFNLRSTYMEDKDNFPLYYVVSEPAMNTWAIITHWFHEQSDPDKLLYYFLGSQLCVCQVICFQCDIVIVVVAAVY